MKLTSIIIILLFTGCTTKTTLFIKNNTDDFIYFQTKRMGIKSPILKPDSLNIFDIVINKKNSINNYLEIAMDKDTVYLLGTQYKHIVDSLLNNKNNVLEVTKLWFEKHKNIEK